jgi:RNA polymerase sigma-70 factor (ECF subfamily)
MPSGQPDGIPILERHRHYLWLLAQVQLDPRLKGKVDLSGVVNQTLFEAHRSIAQVVDHDSGQRLAWLRRILANNLSDELRKLRTGKRDVTREQSLHDAIDRSSIRLEAWLVAKEPPPGDRLDRQEQSLRLADALQGLPDAQREALMLQHWHGWTVAEIADHLGRTKLAVAGLLKRGLQQLRENLDERNESGPQ